MFRNASFLRSGIFQLAALIVAFQLGHAVPAHAQAASAVIAGTISDTQGGVLPGATIVGTGVTTSATSYIVDGVSNAVAKSGEQRHDIPQAAIQEFAVHTTQVPAQYGQRAGGVVNIVTKSGTNNLHGEAFEFFRNQ